MQALAQRIQGAIASTQTLTGLLIKIIGRR
jgi:hypothetical protein